MDGPDGPISTKFGMMTCLGFLDLLSKQKTVANRHMEIGKNHDISKKHLHHFQLHFSVLMHGPP